MKLDASQKAAVAHALSPGRLKIITGGAGTGKTTIIKEVLDKLKIGSLLAPTGKAAARLREVSGLSASTIHSYLGYNPAGGFRRPIAEQITEPLVIDEASMIDSALLASLLRYKPPKVILVGDAAQLPPVGAGQPFHDFCHRMPEMVSTLTTCHRAKGAVHIAAQQVRAGTVPEWELDSDGESWRMIETGLEYPTQEYILDIVRSGDYDPLQDVILSPKNGKTEEDKATVSGLNHDIVRIVNPRDEGEGPWKIGDRVMNKKNNAKLDWYNGDCGTVTAVDLKKNLWVRSERGEEMRLDGSGKANLIHAYAMTVHKSQGSQYRNVYIVCNMSASRMLNRNLIYTAVTRARKSVTVLGQPGAFYGALDCQPFRLTTMQHLIHEQAEKGIPA